MGKLRMNPMRQTKLPLHERIAACLIILFILFLTTLNLYFDEGELPPAEILPQTTIPLVEVTIEGALEHPGVYRVKKGSTVQEAIALAKPLETANLRRIKLDSKITRRRKIIVR